MQKYKGIYIFKYQRDSEGKVYNREDNFIACRSKGVIYRYNEDTLVFESPYKIRLVKKDNEGNLKDYKLYILEIRDTDAEREIFFKEENIEVLEDLFKIRKPKQLSEETRDKLRERMINLQRNKIDDNNLEIEEDLEEFEEETELEENEIEVEENIEE
jgi:hypothetical protein